MIEKGVLLDLARLSGLRPWQQEKHYVQCLVLNALSDVPVAFKGGTCLWFFHGLRRFSEDLDFTAEGAIPRGLPERVSTDLVYYGVGNTIKLVNDNDTTLSFRVSAKGPLNTAEKDVCHVYVEISKRERVVGTRQAATLDVPGYRLPVRIVACMGLDELAAEKVRATMTRKKARDVYDLWFLATSTRARFDEGLINEKLHLYGKTFSHADLVEAAREKASYFERELKPIIFGALPSFEACMDGIDAWTRGTHGERGKKEGAPLTGRGGAR